MSNQNKLFSREEAVLMFSLWLSLYHSAVIWGKDPGNRVMELADEFIKWNDLDQGFSGQISMPPCLWFRVTPSLAKIEWAIRKLIHDVCK